MPRSLEEMITLRGEVAKYLGEERPENVRAAEALRSVPLSETVKDLHRRFSLLPTRNSVAELFQLLDTQIATWQQPAPDNPTASDTEVIDPQDIQEVLESVPPTDEEMPVYAPVENGKRRLSRSGWFGFGE